MTKYLSLDFETSIGKTIHGPTFRDPENDLYTMIRADSPQNVTILHSFSGFKRFKDQPLDLDDVDVIVGHNIAFDLCYIWNHPDMEKFILKGGKIWDTQLAEYHLTGQQHTFASLAELQAKYLGEVEKPSRIGLLYKKGIGADKILAGRTQCPRLFKLYEHYCYTDGSTPLKILKAQYQRAKLEGMLPVLELANDYLLGIINMTCTGIPIDVKLCEKTYQEFMFQHLDNLEKAQEILKKVWTDPRLPKFNVNSPDHKSAVLFGGGIKIVVREEIGVYKNGNKRYKNVEQRVQVKGFGIDPSVSIASKKEGVYSTTDAIMQKIALKTSSNEIKEYCALQKKSMMFKKAANTYCKAFIDRNVNGLLYPNFNNTLTKTGRLSSSEPNMQNISKRNEFGKVLHSMFIAPKGWKCVQIDFSQLEIWVLAWLSGDTQLIQDLLDGVDLHVKRVQYVHPDKTYEELLRLCKGEHKEEYWHKERNNAKTVSYQMVYGAQPKKVVETTGLPMDVVEAIFKKEIETYPEAANFCLAVRDAIESSSRISRVKDIPRSSRSKDGYKGDIELLPIFDKFGNVHYNEQYVRKVGYWVSITGKKYHFLDNGRFYKDDVSRSFSFTQPKNYPMQGSAADIQGATTAELMKALLTKKDRIKMCNEVHDSKWFLIREDVIGPSTKWLKNTIEDIPAIFLRRFGIKVPFKFPIEMEEGDNFGYMTGFN